MPLNMSDITIYDNQLRMLGRWMRMRTIPNQSSVAKAFAEFEEHGRLNPARWFG